MKKNDAEQREWENGTIGIIARLFLSEDSLEEICQAFAGVLAERFFLPVVQIVLYDGSADEVVSLGATGFSDKQKKHVRTPLNKSIYKEVILKCLPVLDNEKTSPENKKHLPASLAHTRTRALVPMSFKGRAVGAIGAADTDGKKHLSSLVPSLQMVADYFAQEVMRRESERDLQKKEVFYRTMVDYQTEFVCRMTPDTTFKFVNATYLRYLDRFQEEVIGIKFIDLLPEPERPALASRLQSLHDGGRAATIEHRWETSHSETRWHRWTLCMLLDENSLPLEILGVGRDCTEERNAHDELKKREAQYRAVVEAQTELIARFLPEGILTFANEAYGRYFGIQREEVLDKHFLPHIFNEDIDAMHRRLRSLCVEQPSCLMEYRVQKPDGSLRWTQWTFTAIPDENNSVIEFQAVGRDIHEVKQLQETIRNNQAILQAMFDGITDPIFMLDENCTIKMVNKATLQYYKVSSTDCHGMPCHKVFRGRNKICEDCDIIEKIKTGEGKSFERAGKVDSNAYEQITIYPLRMAGIDIPTAIIHVKDITKTRMLEKRVSHSERLASLGLLISGIAHEINNPNNFITFNIPVLRDYLNAIMPIIDEHNSRTGGNFTLFGMSYQEFKDDMYKLLDNMQHGSDRINRTVSGLREFIRNQGAKELVWSDLNMVIERAVMLCGSKVKKAARSFSISVDEAVPKLYTDPYALEHMLIIVLVNAAQAVDKSDSFIKLSAFRGTTWQEHVIVEVSDNGCGISRENLDKLFEPFFTTKSSEGGTGLGLYICRDMINGLGGRIEVQSEPGAGTTVRLVVPDISGA